MLRTPLMIFALLLLQACGAAPQDDSTANANSVTQSASPTTGAADPNVVAAAPMTYQTITCNFAITTPGYGAPAGFVPPPWQVYYQVVVSADGVSVAAHVSEPAADDVAAYENDASADYDWGVSAANDVLARVGEITLTTREQGTMTIQVQRYNRAFALWYHGGSDAQYNGAFFYGDVCVASANTSTTAAQ